MSDETTRRTSGDAPMGDDVYQPNETEQEGVVYTGDLENALDEADYDDVLDTGYSPPEKPRAVNAHGTTAAEQRRGETLDERLAEEVPDVEPAPGDGIGDQPGMWGEPVADGQAGEDRAGRLVASHDAAPSRLDDVTAQDVGIDGGAAGAEEASMHIITTDEVASSDATDQDTEPDTEPDTDLDAGLDTELDTAMDTDADRDADTDEAARLAEETARADEARERGGEDGDDTDVGDGLGDEDEGEAPA